MQLPLPVSLPTDETFDSFVSGNNAELVTLLQEIAQAMPAWKSATALTSLRRLQLPVITLVGNEGRGKSHLLYALCHELSARSVGHVYLNMHSASEWVDSVFEGLESLPVICLDNLQAIAGMPQWELALFDLLNRISEHRASMVVCTSTIGHGHPSFQLPDLTSRLAWGVTYQVLGLDDEQRKAVIRLRAAQRGLKFSEQAVQFLLNHSDRDLPSLMALLDRLDTRSLQEQKKLSVGMVKRELDIA
ncbi:DnaA regulatory inactivator Hda [Alteromonas halophila]|uniref:DnaA regulatory inactivator Hda n=1 Tax=Alteromonas halophila TaxID=516698 RepID=A0A918JPU5_9ALTE|nr:DnaA regulatory inactivator Hda [Alteromonas halophila]GGW95872.1 DnaA regulatory inactivator Hda [Alteromonas halophila]